MKKLMFAAAVCAAGAAMAVESNIVGYENLNNDQGNTYQVAPFNSVGEEGFNLQTLIPAGDNTLGGGETTLMTLNANKTTAHIYYWLTDDEWGTTCGLDGWFDGTSSEDTKALSTRVFEPCEGFIFYSQDGEATCTFSGEVKYPVEKEVGQGNTLTGNFWPTNMGIQDISPSGDTTLGGGETTLMTLNSNKTTKHIYYWLTDDEWGTTCGEDGWFDGTSSEDTKALSTKTFVPGEGFLFYSQDGEAKLSFPEFKVK